jgi:hypothetical protein
VGWINSKLSTRLLVQAALQLSGREGREDWVKGYVRNEREKRDGKDTHSMRGRRCGESK